MITRAAFQEVSAFLDEPGPAALGLVGPPRSGKSWLLRQAARARADARPVFWVRGSDLPGPLMARDAGASLRRQRAPDPGTPPADGSPESGDGDPWEALARELGAIGRTEGGPVLVVDRADAILADRRFAAVLRAWWQDLRARSRPAHLLFGLEGRLPLTTWTEGAPEGRPEASVREVTVGPLTLREAATTVPDWSAPEIVETYAVVGGLPDFWSRVRAKHSPQANLRRLLLEPGAPLRHLPYLLLGRASPGPDRQWAVLSAMARGARTWGDIRRESRVFRTSSELGPYLKGLRERGLVEAHRSLDAPPRSRSRRYRLTRPLVAFWLGAAHPHLPELDRGDPFDELWDERIGAAVRSVIQRQIPTVVEQYLRLHGDARLPGRAREVGGIWSAGCELPVAATLETGAVLYGAVHWEGTDGDALARLGRQIRETRYGFNREARLRLIVLRRPPEHALARAVARAGDAWTLTATDLVGAA